MKTIKTAKYEKLALIGTGYTAMIVQEVVKMVNKMGLDLDTAIQEALGPETDPNNQLYQIVKTEAQKQLGQASPEVTKPFDSVDDGMASLGGQAIPVHPVQ